MPRARVLLMCPFALALGSFALAAGDELPAAQPASSEPASAELPGPSGTDISAWLKALRSDDFEVRSDATRRLIAAGESAVESVTRTAETGDLETSSRCLEILKRLRSAGDASAKAAAEKALEALTKSENRSVAQRAAAITWKPDPNVGRMGVRGFRIVAAAPVPGAPVPFPRKFQRDATVEENGRKIELREVLGQELIVKVTETVDGKPKTTEYKAASSVELLQKSREAHDLYRKHLRGKKWEEVADPKAAAAVPVAGNVQIQVGGGLAGARHFRVQTRINNGNREVEVDDNGKKVLIKDESGKNITIKVTEKQGDKETTREYQAADIEELRKKHPEGAALYDQYGKGGVNIIQINANGGIQIEGGALPGLPGRPLPIPARPLPR